MQQRLNLNRPRLPRRRVVKACQPCRNAKTKCDQGRPQCQQCATNNRPCVYTTDRIRDNESEPQIHQDSDQPIWSNQVGHLEPCAGTEIRYYSSTSWVFTLKDKGPALSSGARKTSETEAKLHREPFPGSYNEQDREQIDQLRQLDRLVSPEEVDRLIRWYADCCHFWYPVVDLTQVTAALKNHRCGKVVPPGSASLIAAMCHIASCSLAVSGDMGTAAMCSEWRGLAHDYLSRTGYPSHSNLQTLRAAFLLGLQSTVEFPSNLNPAPLSVLVRTAQIQGLHRDPLMLQLSMDEADSNRILWWCIYALDVSQSVAHALPTLIHSAHVDVQVPLRNGMRDRRLLHTLIFINKVFSKIFDGIYGIQQPTEATLCRLDAEVEVVCRSEASSAGLLISHPLDQFIALCQRASCWKLKYILHQPYLRSPQWPRSSRDKALDSSMKYIDEFIMGMTEPTFAPYRWVLHHFTIFHASALILQDLISFPGSSESTNLRRVIETAFSTFYIDSDPTWTKLAALQSKAWTKNGWNVTSSAEELSVTDLLVGDIGLSDWDPLFALLDFTG